MKTPKRFVEFRTNLKGGRLFLNPHKIIAFGEHITGGVYVQVGSGDDHILTTESIRSVLEKLAACEQKEESALLTEALGRSPYDILPCYGCNKPVVCIPDGVTLCSDCAKDISGEVTA